MTNESKNRWSVIINIALTTLTALLSAFAFTVRKDSQPPLSPIPGAGCPNLKSEPSAAI